MKKIIRNPHSYFKTTQETTSVLQEPPAGFQAPTIVFENDCSVSVTYGDNPAFKINTKIEDVSNVIKVTTNTTRLADNVSKQEYLHIYNNDYYRPVLPNVTKEDYADIDSPFIESRFEWETYHARHLIIESRDYYNEREAKERFLSKNDFFNGLAAGLGLNAGIVILSLMFQYYYTEKTFVTLFPLEFSFKLNTALGNKVKYQEYVEKCINLYANKKSYFQQTPTNFVKMITYDYTPYTERLPPLLQVSIEPARGLMGDRGLDAGEMAKTREEPDYIPPDALRPNE